MNYMELEYLGMTLEITWLGVAGRDVEIMAVYHGGADILSALECMHTKDGPVLDELAQMIHEKEAR